MNWRVFFVAWLTCAIGVFMLSGSEMWRATRLLSPRRTWVDVTGMVLALLFISFILVVVVGVLAALWRWAV